MTRKISTFYADDDKGYAEVWFHPKNENFFIDYFDSKGKRFFTEEVNGTLRAAENVAEDWVLGYHKLEHV